MIYVYLYFLHVVASYDTQEGTLGLFYFPGPTGGMLHGEMKVEVLISFTRFIGILPCIGAVAFGGSSLHNRFASTDYVMW